VRRAGLSYALCAWRQQSTGGKPLDIKHTALTKEVPGGVFSMM
jgi:hypothetical protein